jgi:hypothetical protein
MPCCQRAHIQHTLIAASPWRLRTTSAGGKLSDHMPSQDGRGCRGLDGCQSGRCPSASFRPSHSLVTRECGGACTSHIITHHTHITHHTSHIPCPRAAEGHFRAACHGQRKSKDRGLQLLSLLTAFDVHRAQEKVKANIAGQVVPADWKVHAHSLTVPAPFCLHFFCLAQTTGSRVSRRCIAT